MEKLFEEIGLEGIAFVLVTLGLILLVKFSVEWSIIIGLISAVIVYSIKRSFRR